MSTTKRRVKAPGFLRSATSSRSLKVAGSAAAAGLLVAGVAFAGVAPAAAEENPLAGLMPSQSGPSVNPSLLPNLVNQNPKSAGNQSLNVTVGKSMLVATGPNGEPNTSVLLANTQVSGKGASTVQIPMGGGSVKSGDGFAPPTVTNGNVVYNINSPSATQENYSVTNASYSGQLPIKVEVNTFVDGKQIEPKDFVNITGHVKITYRFTNTTAEPTKISYKGPGGGLITETVPLPVPFGGAFSSTLPQGFADVNAPWAEGGLGPTGTTLAGTLFLFPPLGKLTSELTLEARAENASLPTATLNALPLTLSDNSLGRLAFKYAPVAGDAVDKIYQGGLTGESMLLKYQLMLLKYSAIVAGINTKYIQPLVDKIENGGPLVASTTKQIQELADGSAGLALLLPQATDVINILQGGIAKGDALYEESVGSPDSSLNKLISKLESSSNTLNKAANALDPATVNGVLTAGVGAASKLASTAVDMCPQVNTYMNSYYTSYQGELDTAAGLLAITEPQTANQLVALNRFLGSFIEQNQAQVKTCMQLAPTVLVWTDQLKEMLPQLEDGITKALNLVKKAAAGVTQGVTYAELFQELEPTVTKLLNNSNCTYNKETGKGIQSCGLVQQITFLDAKMKYATDQVVNVMAPGTAKAAEMIPLIDKYFALAQKYAPAAGAAANAAPAELDSYAAKLGVYAGLADTAVGYAGKAETLINKTTAEMEIMNARAEAGQGLAAGPAQGANSNLGAYMYSIGGSSDAGRQNAIRIGLAALLFVIGAGTAAALYARRKA